MQKYYKWFYKPNFSKRSKSLKKWSLQTRGGLLGPSVVVGSDQPGLFHWSGRARGQWSFCPFNIWKSHPCEGLVAQGCPWLGFCMEKKDWTSKITHFPPPLGPMPPKWCRLTLLPISLVLLVFSKEFILFPAPQKAFHLLIFEALNSTSRRSAVIMARAMARVMVQPSWHGAEMTGVGGAVQWCLSFGGWIFGWVCEIGSRGSTGWCRSSH